MDIEKIKTYILSLATVPSCKPRTRGYVKKEDRADIDTSDSRTKKSKPK